jgi:hypothetical protein
MYEYIYYIYMCVCVHYINIFLGRNFVLRNLEKYPIGSKVIGQSSGKGLNNFEARHKA